MTVSKKDEQERERLGELLEKIMARTEKITDSEMKEFQSLVAKWFSIIKAEVEDLENSDEDTKKALKRYSEEQNSDTFYEEYCRTYGYSTNGAIPQKKDKEVDTFYEDYCKTHGYSLDNSVPQGVIQKHSKEEQGLEEIYKAYYKEFDNDHKESFSNKGTSKVRVLGETGEIL